ncbi:Heteroproteinous nuclear ribonucleoprotein A1, partial [Kickxella alabastrina]
LFVGGLSWETDENRLREYFSKYGTIIDCSIMRDQTTGRPRGFGFVTFENIDGVNAVLQEPTHTVDGKQIDPKHAIPRDNQVSQGRNNYSGGQQSHGGSVGNYNANSGGDGGYGNNNSNGGGRNSYEDPTKDMRGEKVFVGGLPPSATDADLNSGFAEFGVITETKLMMDRETGRSRGYGFLQFETEDAAMQAVKIGNSGDGIMIHGKRVDVKPAVRKKPSPMMGGMPGAQGNSYGMMAGMPGYGMMGMGMMGMPGYSMMGMPGYGMMGAGGAASGMDYSAAMNYGGYYGNMAGFYGGGVQGDSSGAVAGADGSAAAAGGASSGYYSQMNMPGAYYGGAGADGSAIADSQGDGSGGKGGDQSGSGYYDQKQSGGTLSGGYNKSAGRQHDGRGNQDRNGRDSGGHRSSSRRYDGGGGRANDGGNMGGRSDRDRPRGDNSGNAGNSGSRTRDDYRGSRGAGARPSRDRDGPVRGSHGASSSRKPGYNPY